LPLPLPSCNNFVGSFWLRFEGVVSELYDVVSLPGIRRPSMIGFRSQEIRRVVSIES